MKKHLWLSLLAIAFILTACDKENYVKIATSKGDVLVKLYNQTPKHRDNFLKLTKDGFFDGLLFHRVINEFMIQGGDPDSRGAKEMARLGSGGPGYKVDAEIVPELFHKKGALSAARQGDRANPERKSSGSQFYIVQGEVWTSEDLDKLEKQKRQNKVRSIVGKLMEEHKDSLMGYQKANNYDAFTNMRMRLQKEADSIAAINPFTFSEAAREAYTTIGGTPHLDGDYTVFGEVVVGLDIVDSIASVKTNPYDRPIEDITMSVEEIKFKEKKKK